MNAGIGIATGAYIMYLGCDDFILPQGFERCLTALEQVTPRSLGVIGSGTILCFNVLLGHDFVEYPSKKFGEILQYLHRGEKLPHQGIVIPRAILAQLRGFDTNYKIASDFDLCLRAKERNIRFDFYDYPVVRYSPGGISGTSRVDDYRILLKRGYLWGLAVLASRRLWNALSGAARLSKLRSMISAAGGK
jgi:hypothetical protein